MFGDMDKGLAVGAGDLGDAVKPFIEGEPGSKMEGEGAEAVVGHDVAADRRKEDVVDGDQAGQALEHEIFLGERHAGRNDGNGANSSQRGGRIG